MLLILIMNKNVPLHPTQATTTTFTLEQKSGFKLEINKDLTSIVIIIDID